MSLLSVSIIVLNWNGWDDTLNCLNSLEKITFPDYNIILIDNGSTDESLEKLTFSYMSDKVTLIKNKENIGFARACNQGIRFAIREFDAGYVLLLNNDTIVYPGLLQEMLMKIGANTGMVQPLMLKMFNPSIIDSTGLILSKGAIVNRGEGEVNRGQYKGPQGLIGASGAAGLYRSDMFMEIGFLDEFYDSGYEDSEFAWRAWKAGWKTEYAPRAIVHHKRSVSLLKRLETDPEFNKKFYEDASGPCRTHGTPLQKAEFITDTLWTATKSGIGKVIGRNNVGTRPYINTIRKFFE